MKPPPRDASRRPFVPVPPPRPRLTPNHAASLERELKLVLHPHDYLRLSSSLPGYAGERWLANHYFDTADLALRGAGTMLRVRESSDGRTIGLKQAIVARGGTFEAAESEEPIDEHDWRRVVRSGGDLGLLGHPVVREALALAGCGVVSHLGSLRVLRKAYRLAAAVVLELDLVLYGDGSQDCELEVETERLAAVRPFLEELLARKGVGWQPQELTKYERFLARPTRQPPRLFETLEGGTIQDEDGVAVRQSPLRGTGVFTTRGFEPGERILDFTGPRVTGTFPRDRGMGWIQVGPETFVDPAGTAARHVNHSCLPTAGIRGTHTLIALLPLRAGEEVTYDFAMTEYDLELVCHCGTAACRGLIGGYRRLPEGLRWVYSGLVSDYLLRLEPVVSPAAVPSESAPARRDGTAAAAAGIGADATATPAEPAVRSQPGVPPEPLVPPEPAAALRGRRTSSESPAAPRLEPA